MSRGHIGKRDGVPLPWDLAAIESLEVPVCDRELQETSVGKGLGISGLTAGRADRACRK